MEKTKKLIIILIIILVIVCVAFIVLMNLNTNDSQEPEQENVLVGDPLVVEYEIQKLNDPTKFYSIESYIKNNLDQNFIAEDMNILEGEVIASFAVQGKIEGSNDNIFIIFRIDDENMTYSMEKLDNVTDINEINLNTDITEIANNGTNNFEYTTVTSEEMCRIYFDDFRNIELTDPEKAYSMLNEEYRNERFPRYEDYIEYLDGCREIIQTASLTSYYVEIIDDYTEYTFVDNYGMTYTVRAQGVLDYNIMLDDYTIKVDTYEENYSQLEDAEKVYANAYIFIEMINTKDYRHAYELLDETFRNNNFSTLEQFEEYVNNNFFTFNFQDTTNANVQSQGNTYIYQTTIRNSAGAAAESKNLTVIMQLLDGTDFVMSFSLQ